MVRQETGGTKRVRMSSKVEVNSSNTTTHRLRLTGDECYDLNRKERLLNSMPMQSTFSQLLRHAIKPNLPVSRPSTRVAKRHCHSKTFDRRIDSAVSLPSSQYRVVSGVTPSLRMTNEESSFTQYVRLNKSAYHRLENSCRF